MTNNSHPHYGKFPFKLPDLPYSKNAFEPHLSSESFDFHYGIHHNNYVSALNGLIESNEKMLALDLEQIIKVSYTTNSAIFNNAAQIWNHTFFWHSITPNGGGAPSGAILNKIIKKFGSYNQFIIQFKQVSLGHFGSGWVWLVLNNKGELEIIKTVNADNPLTKGVLPILACDLWEHAYYIDYRNRRADYISTFLNHMINWDFALINISRYIACN